MKFLNEEMTPSFEQFEDKCHRLALGVANSINKYLDTYGFEVEYVPEYEDFLDEMENCVGLFLASEQDSASVFPMTLNIPFLFEYFSEDGHIGAELDWAIESTMWHEAGHGIVAYLSDFYDFDWDEEEIVEEFARCMCDGLEQCELINALEEYSKETFEESCTSLEESYDPPYNEQQVRDNYGEETYQRLIKDPAHLWRMRTGIELIHREPSKKELERIWTNWQLMSDSQKRISDEKSIELFGKTNEENYNELIKLYESVELWNNLEEFLSTKTVRRDNPNDFSPFGYKVDFYDGDTHIGEGSVCGVKDDSAFLYDFEVYPEHRGKGYSKEMLQYLIDQYDLKSLFVKPDNTIAINLYKKYGFKFDDDSYDPADIGNMRLMIRESYKMRFKLTEGKNLEQTVQQYINKYQKILPLDDDQQDLHRNQVMGLIEIDPTYKKGSNTTGDYAIWILNLAMKNGWDVLGTKDRVLPVLIDFIDKKSLLKNKDINSYKSLDELKDTLSQVELTDRQKERRSRNAMAMTKKVLSTENFDIYMALNWEGALTLGKGTKWCTADSENAAWYVKYVTDYWHYENVEAFEVKDCGKERHITVQELIDYPKFLYGEHEIKTEQEIYDTYSDRAVFVDVQGEGFFVNPYAKLDDNNPPYNRLFVFIDKRDGSKYQFCMSEELSEYEEDLEYALTFCDSKDVALDFRDFIGYRHKELRQFWEEVMGYALQELFSVDPDAEDEDLDESLNEGIEDMKKFYPNIPEDKFQSYIELDPTYKQGSTQAGKYAKWILGLANQGKLDNLGHIKDLLTRFHSERNRLKNKDIMKYKSMEELDSALSSEDSYSELSDRQKLRQTQKAVHNVDLGEEAELLYSDSDWEVWTPNTYEASCKLGRGTSWCTATTEDDYYFNYYTDRGPLYINIDKKTGKKYQFHFETDSFMDENDTEITLSRLFAENEKLFDVYASFADQDFVDAMQVKLTKMKALISKLNENNGVLILDEETDEEEFLSKSSDADLRELVTEVLFRNVECPHTRLGKYPNLKKVTFGEGVVRIRSEQLRNSLSLTTVIIQEGVQIIDYKAFCDCMNLVEVSLPSSLREIKSDAFAGCRALSNITLPDGLTTIYSKAFMSCTSLTSVVIPRSVTYVGEASFGGCGNLKRVEYLAKTTIPKRCFSSSYALEDIVIEEGVNAIEQEAFYYSGLKSITLPESVTTIYENAFGGCHKLRYIKISSSTKECHSSSFPLEATVVSDTYNKYVAHMLDGSGVSYVSSDNIKESLTHKMRFLLKEDIEAVKKNFPTIEDDVFMTLIALDPTYNSGRDSVGNYGKWILNLYKKGEIKEDDFENVSQMLDVWETNKKRFTNRDIGQFKTLKQLEDTLLDMPDLELSHRQKVRQNQKARKYADLGNEAELVYHDGDWEVYIPKTYAASCKLGQNSSWCTATTEDDHYFKYYSSMGPLYVIIDKHSDKRKFQFHFESNQFMNIEDDRIDLIDFLDNNTGLDNFFTPILVSGWGYPNATNDTIIEMWFDRDCIEDALHWNDGKWNCYDGDTALQFIYEPGEYFLGYYYEGFYEELLAVAIDCMDEESWKMVTSITDVDDPEELCQLILSQENEALYEAFMEAMREVYEESAAKNARSDAIAELENAAVYCRGISADFRDDGKLYVSGRLQDMMRIFHAYHTEMEDVSRDMYDNWLQVAVASCIMDQYSLYKTEDDAFGEFEDEEFNEALQRSISEWIREDE